MTNSYSVIYEDENYLIVNKKSGILVHKTKHEQENLIDQIILDRGKNHYLVHRLDKYTSGVLMIAKNKEVLQLTQNLFSNNSIEKTYLAITTKKLPAKKVKINISLGINKNNKLMFSNRNAKNHKPSCTYVEAINNNFIKLSPKTGRTHQLRAHLNEINCPILNDPIYGEKCFDKEFGQFLHAYKIKFTCPLSGKNISITAELPNKFLEKLKELNINSCFT